MSALIFGRLPAGTVRDSLVRIRAFLSEASVAVIRSIDSARSQADLSQALSFHDVPYEVYLGNVQLTMESLWKAVAAKVFTGFDEVWVLPDGSTGGDLSQAPSATSDGADFSDGVPKELGETMERAHCILVVGDGCGLNYATSDERIARRIVSGRVDGT